MKHPKLISKDYSLRKQNTPLSEYVRDERCNQKIVVVDSGQTSQETM